MNYFLYQPPRLDESDVVYCNAERITDSRKRVEVYDKITEIYNGVRSKSYPWFGKKNGYYVLKGLFNAKDEKGRTMSFFFASNEEGYGDKIEYITTEIGYAVSQSTQQAMVDFLKKKKRNQLTKWFFVVLVLILLVLIICFLINNA